MIRRLIVDISYITLAFFCITITACNSDSQKANIVSVRLTADPSKLNPVTTEDANSIMVSEHIFMSLLDFDPKTLNMTPTLAKSRPQVVPIDTGKYKGGAACIYEIKDEAVWDNGQPVTAADYIFTLKAIFHKKVGASNQRSTIDFIKDIVVDAQNPRKFTIYSDKRYILYEVNSGTIDILPEYIYDTEGVLKKFTFADFIAFGKDTTKWSDSNLVKFASSFQSTKFSHEKAGIIGCGAYVFDNWIAGQSLTLKKKDNWWGSKLASSSSIFEAAPEQIVFKPIKDNATAVSLMKNEDLDAVMGIPLKEYNAMKQDARIASKYTLDAVSLPSLALIGFNCKIPQLSDKNVRRAIAHTIDLPTVIKNIAGGFGTINPSPFVAQRPYFNKNLQPIAFDIEKAKILLATAGWKDSDGNGIVEKVINGKKMELTLRYIFSANESTKNLALLVQDNAKKAGININLVPFEGNALLPALSKRDFDMYFIASTFPPSLDDPKELWASSSNTPDGGNRFQFENKQADALIDKIRSELDENKRNELYMQFQSLIYEEQPAIFLFQRQERIAVHNRFDAPIIARRPGYAPNMFKIKK